jgi:tRNA A-37 threonylcarbamoyl transferase component Bud32
MVVIMEKVVMDDSLRTRLIKLNPDVHTESDIYCDFSYVYKIFVNYLNYKKKAYLEYLKRKRQKIELLSGIQKLPNVVLPKQLVFDGDDNFLGLSMDFILNSKTLNKFFSDEEFSLFVKLLLNVSTDMKKIHRRNEGLVFGDFTFSNILVDENLKHYFIDFDSVGVLNLPCERISPQLGDYSDYKGKRIKIDKNSDRISFILSFFEYVFSKKFFDISLYDFDEKTEKISILRDFRNIFVELLREDSKIPQVPYFHEVLYSNFQTDFARMGR